MLGIMRFWYERGADGFRLDAITALAPDRDLRSNPPIPSDEPLPYVDGGVGNPFLKQIHLFDRDGPDVLPMLSAFRQLANEYCPPRFLLQKLAMWMAVSSGQSTPGQISYMPHSFRTLCSPNYQPNVRLLCADA